MQTGAIPMFNGSQGGHVDVTLIRLSLAEGFARCLGRRGRRQVRRGSRGPRHPGRFGAVAVAPDVKRRLRSRPPRVRRKAAEDKEGG